MATSSYDPVSDTVDRTPLVSQSAVTRGARRHSIDASSDASSTEFRDQLEVEPFDEKGNRFRDDPAIEEDAGEGEDGQGYPVEPSRRLRPRQKSRKILAVLIVIVCFAALIGGLAATGYSAPTYLLKSGNRRITMDHVFNGTFNAYTKQLDWVKEADDGTFSHVNRDGNIVLATVHNMTDETVLVDSSKVLDLHGNKLHWQTWQLSADMEYVLFKTDHVKQWRHSSFGNYWVHRRSDSVTFPVIPPSTHPTTTLCKWSPVGHALAFVNKNDLYVITEEEMHSAQPKPLRITEDGSDVIFNGVPDWVYEEEVFETDSAVWWSPDAQTLAYLRSDESAVKDFKLQYYNPSSDAFETHQYQSELDMKYPKPGTPNPLCTVHSYTLATQARQQLSWEGEMPLDNRIIVEIGWVADDALLVKEIDRAARVGSVILFEGGANQGDIVRTLGENGEEGDGGWIDHGQNVIPVKGAIGGYLDIVPNEGFNHIAFFSPLNATRPIWVTSGEWEVIEISGVDAERGLIYFMSANPSIDRHLYSAPIPSAEEEYEPALTALTDTSSPGYYTVSFSPGGRYYVLAYKGPEVPWQRLMETGEEEDRINELLEGNAKLNETLSEFVRPIITRTTIESDGYELNMLEMLPPNIDTSGRKKYPVLIRVYGGPGSQMVSNRFDRDWHTFLVTSMKYVVIMIDGRGTGFKGRNLRNPVRDDLGHWEVVDQIAAAKEMVKRGYVDRDRVGIWGWSYGGYMTCKTIEADSGIFTLGMAVAPVTNWLYYDSIYTERYMSTPSANELGYLTSAVNNVTSFSGDKVDFIWAHGSGDDNVHYANSASLLDKLTQRHVRGWRFRMFTDS
ncbi:dipeptidyl aminopeptidase [Kwoniella heveanensis CBS 569]|nr:dipeptidyl aminopeptidase [Kwoniella heveanensis CBS 569]